MRFARTDLLEIAFIEEGPVEGWPVILAHGFPFDVHAYDEVVPQLVRKGARVIVPYLRGFGPTRFLSATTMRSGQQAALGRYIIDLLDALGIETAILAGYDSGGLSSCVASALWPERVTGLVSYAAYDIWDKKRARHAYEPALEHVQWYQHLFQIERGRECLALYRRELCRMLWEQCSPSWSLTKPPSRERPFPSTIRFSSTWSYIATASASVRRRATRLWHRWNVALTRGLH